MMNDASVYLAMKIAAAAFTVVSVCIATAINLPDLGLTKQSVAVLSVVQAGISATLLFLPAVNKQAGNRRGDATDDVPERPT